MTQVSKCGIARVILCLAVLSGASSAYAKDTSKLDAASSEALSKTLEILRDPDLKSSNPANQQVMAITGNDSEAAVEIYNLAADIFQRLIVESEGDAVKAMEALESAKKDPKAFANSLSPEIRQKLKSIGNRLPASKPKAVAP